MTNKRESYISPEEIISQVREVLDLHKPGEIDWVTFVGSGETTLHASIGYLIRQVKLLTVLPIAVITNGSLLYLPTVRRELALADAVLPTLDAGEEELYRKINRPHPDITFKRHVDGLRAFRKEYQGKLWIEVMLIHGLNDTEEALKQIATLLQDIQPDEVHILQPTRPPAETWVKPADEERLLRAYAILGKTARIIAPARGSFDLSGDEDLLDAITNVITRHPMSEEELIEALSRFSKVDVVKTLQELQKSGKAQTVNRYGVRFWSASGAFYPMNEK